MQNRPGMAVILSKADRMLGHGYRLAGTESGICLVLLANAGLRLRTASPTETESTFPLQVASLESAKPFMPKLGGFVANLTMGYTHYTAVFCHEFAN